MFDPSIKRTYPMTVAFILMHGAYAQIPEAFGRLYAWLSERALMPAGMPAGVYLSDPATTSETDIAWELWAPVADGTPPFNAGEDGLGVKVIPAGTVASVMHKGPYESVDATYTALGAWLVESGYTVAGPPREIYFSDPEETPLDETLTEVQFPVRSV